MDKTHRNFAKNVAIIIMKTFLKSGINLDLSGIFSNFSNSLGKKLKIYTTNSEKIR